MLKGNYFKVITTKKTYFLAFDGWDLTSTTRAWSMVRHLNGSHTWARISMWKPPFHEGPWDLVSIVGHRDRDLIKRDLRATSGTDHEGRARRQAELDALEEEFSFRAVKEAA